jgi:hypothetical protein
MLGEFMEGLLCTAVTSGFDGVAHTVWGGQQEFRSPSSNASAGVAAGGAEVNVVGAVGGRAIAAVLNDHWVAAVLKDDCDDNIPRCVHHLCFHPAIMSC